MTSDPRVTALMSFGYTPNQAAFLALVALHGGYFLRRQYVAFLGCIDGAVVSELIMRLLERHHATRATFCRETKVYHLSARPLFEALSLGNSRNRRPAPAAAITFKLMTLDVVLRHRNATFLATEAEKVAYFTTTCGLSRAVLPAVCYQSRTPGRPPTTRYFVDKAPIFTTPSSPDITVVYLQGWSTTLTGLETFLLQYRALLTALPHARVMFVTTNPTLIPDVTARWRHLWGQSAPSTPCVSVSRTELEAHFLVRQHIDRKEWHVLEQHDLDRHRNDLARFSSPQIDALYRRWCMLGEPAFQTVDLTDGAPAAVPPPLDTELLPYRYPLFPAAGHHQ